MLTSEFTGVWTVLRCETGGGTGGRDDPDEGRQINSSSLSERSNEWVELESEIDDKDRSVYEDGKPRSGKEGAKVFKGLSLWNSLRVGELVLRLWPAVLWKKPSHLDLMLSSGWAKVSRLHPSPTAANRAPHPSRTSSERRPPTGLFLHGGVLGAWLRRQYSSPSVSMEDAPWVSFWKGMQR